MQSTYLYTKYYQKSLCFLYPLIGIDKDETFAPSGCYLWWNGEESIDDMQLIVAYDTTKKKVFPQFERRVLLSNPYLDKCYDVEGGKVYIFDLSSYGDTVKKFLAGKYSKMSDAVKHKILKYHGIDPSDKEVRPGRYVHMTLYPNLYYEEVAAELKGVPVSSLKEVEELTNAYNEKKEFLDIKIIGECERKQLTLEKK